ncbi:oxidoreductase [Burkholderia stagnalis]|uniref:phage tail protein n=1 Tax=Burkholderia stagnalis TaxID=1503054 RepID=UPI00075D60CF|nr:phage tail protein [Burkholderia stagnalis]KVC61552.1 oxidoreductase [Burkholderia stagnalis]KVD90249.1 oxidoreductase [Burkholderia stagnalis]KVN15132.1 oxidoreductase [Burkholderia stagnalis]KVN28279.1 oxidoreductase [Burkholderia stagnalis]KVO53357.1 oxidoreductase [Burkholderia stagnalis]
MMMSLNQFVFSLATAPYRELKRQRSWKHPTSSRIGVRDASQFAGVGNDTITLSGSVAPDNGIGEIASVEALAQMGDVGDAYVLVDGQGYVYGAYVIESMDVTGTYHTKEGVPRKIDFNLTLKRVDDSALAAPPPAEDDSAPGDAPPAKHDGASDR